MSETVRITIDMDARCLRCKKKGAVNGGMCLKCMLKELKKRIRSKDDLPQAQ